MRITSILFLLFFSYSGYTQLWQIEIGTNPLMPLENDGSRHHEFNQSGNIYAEIRAFRTIKPNWSIGIFAGFENKRKLSFYQLTQPQPGDVTTWIPQPVQRYFLPLGIATRYHADNWLNKLVGSKKEKWLGYAQAGMYMLAGTDKNEGVAPPEGKPYIEIYSSIDSYGNVFPILTVGVGYNLNRKVYVSTEGGLGALYPIHFSLGCRF